MKKIHYFFVLMCCAIQLNAQTVVEIIVGSENHNTLEAAVIAAELADDLSGDGPFTVFAPTDAAFAALPAGTVDALLSDPTGNLASILLYHVLGQEVPSSTLMDGDVFTTLFDGQQVTIGVNMGTVTVNGAMVTVADMDATNGVVHVIDAVLMPILPQPPTTVVDVIVNSPVHNTLEAAVIAAGLADDLSGAGPFTVFAPTDDAFAALPAGLIDYLLQNPSGDLAQVLLYHVAAGEFFSGNFGVNQTLLTLQGQEVNITFDGTSVFVNTAQVVLADIMADNGVVHVIDAVLVPNLEGCTDALACNYSPIATIDSECIAEGSACDDDNDMTINDMLSADCICVGDLLGCTNMSACNYNMDAIEDDGTCYFTGDACDDGNELTIGDTYDADCGCAGTIVTTTVVDIIVNSPDHNTLETAVIAAGLADDLSGDGPFTVFAPTDAAFAALPAGVLDALLADPTGELANILLYHVVAGSALSTDLSNGQMITTLLGEDITVTVDMNGVMINNAMVVVADILADNGVVHVIDAVLLPPPPQPGNTILDVVVNSDVHNTLEAAVLAAGLEGALAGPGPLTVFAPTDAAFAALPAGTLDALLADPTGALTQVLLYHAVAGVALSTDLSDGQMIATIQGQDVTVTITDGNVFINDAQVIVADITADNGVVHVIDAVLVPQSNPQPETVVDIIVNSPNHTVLETAVIAAGLADDLSGDGPFTVFAPTDAAFAALPAGVLDALLADPTGDLASVLLYHVVAGEALSSGLNNGQSITTLNGASIVVSITDGNVIINDAQVVMADIMADNGVVHVIDAVLTPETVVNEASLSAALVYPNPAADQLTVTMPSMLNHATYSVYSTTGVLVSTGMMTTTTTTLNVDMLSQGMYQLKINYGAECVTRTFMKK